MLSKQEYVGLLAGAAQRRLKHAIAVRAGPHRVSSLQFWVLVALAGNSGLSLSALAELQGMQIGNASRVVASLVGRKLVKVQRDASDRRKSHLELTANGALLARKLQREADEVRGAAESGMSAEESERLRALLRRVIENLDQLDRARS